VLKHLGVTPDAVQRRLEMLVEAGPEMIPTAKLPQMPSAKKVIEYAIAEARGFNHNYAGTEHLLLGLLRDRDTVAGQVLMNLGLELEDVRDEVNRLLGGSAPPPGPAPQKLKQLRRKLDDILDAFYKLLGAKAPPSRSTSHDFQPPEDIAEGLKRFGNHPEVKTLVEKLEATTQRKEECVMRGEYERAAELRDEANTCRSRLEDLFERLKAEADERDRPNGHDNASEPE
jgi:ATP-dependent Clp protease ATP-binding subunit ClpA